MFIFRLTDCEEIIREHLRTLRQSEARLVSLEKENLTLQSKVDLLSKEKSSITRELQKSKVWGSDTVMKDFEE